MAARGTAFVLIQCGNRLYMCSRILQEAAAYFALSQLQNPARSSLSECTWLSNNGATMPGQAASWLRGPTPRHSTTVALVHVVWVTTATDPGTCLTTRRGVAEDCPRKQRQTRDRGRAEVRSKLACHMGCRNYGQRYQIPCMSPWVSDSLSPYMSR